MTHAFYAVVELGLACGVTRISELPGCWERDIDGHWWIAVNGGTAPRECSRGATVPAVTAYVEYNGFPAGFLGPSAGILAGGEAANEGALIAAVEAATAKWIDEGPVEDALLPAAVVAARGQK